MSTSPKIERFNGQNGFLVEDSGAAPGELDAGDTVRRGAQVVAHDDPELVAALAAFERSRALIGEARQRLSSFELGLHPNTRYLPTRVSDETPAQPPRAPSEQEVEELRDAMRGVAADGAALSPRLRSEAQLLAAWAESIITRDFTSFILSKVSSAARAFESMRAATFTDPTNGEAWFVYSVAVLSTATSSARSIAEARVGVTVAEELPRIAAGLASRPESVECVLALEQVARLAAAEGLALPIDLEALRATVPELRAAQSEAAAAADHALRKVRRKLDETTAPTS